MKKIRRFFLPLTMLCSSQALYSQTTIDGTVAEALTGNIVLKEKNVALQTSLVAVQQAKGLFLPTVWFEGQYVLAKGGRTIDIPVGDLVNPIYKTLNQLTAANSFRYVDNVSEQLLPNNFYDTRIKSTMPLFNPEIKYNRAIKQQQVQLASNEVAQYKRELVLQVKVACYNYLMATRSITIYQNAMEVVQQQVRANEALLKNGRGLPAYVSRAESEVQNVASQLQDAMNQQKNAAAYINFLLNRPLDTEVHLDDPAASMPLPGSIPAAANVAAREELQSLTTARDINKTNNSVLRAFAKPRINLFLDLASQGQNFKFDRKTVFYFGGVQVQVPLYAGKRNLYKIQQSNLEAEAQQYNLQNTTKQLELAAYTSRNNIMVSYANYLAAGKQLQAAQAYFKLIDRGYKEGVNSFLEFLDARNQLTNTSLKVNLQQYKYLSAIADLERETATYSINQKP